MPRARHNQNIRQTAAANEYEGSGCLSVFMLPPLIVLFVGLLLAFFAANIPAQATTLQMANAELAPFFTPEVDYWAAAISRWANASNLDPNLVAVVMQIESCGNPSARSSAGAMGLFQVMPFHFFVTDSMTRTQMPRVDWLISSALSMRPRMMFDWHWQVITAVSASLQALN